MREEKEEGSTDENSHSKHKIKVTQVSIIKEKHSRYTPPTNQVWEEKEEESTDENSHSKYKIKVTHVLIIKEKHSRYTPSTNQCWEEKEEGITDDSSYSKHKIKVTQVSVIKKNIQGTHNPLIRCGRKNKREVMVKAAIQNTKQKRHKF